MQKYINYLIYCIRFEPTVFTQNCMSKVLRLYSDILHINKGTVFVSKIVKNAFIPLKTCKLFQRWHFRPIVPNCLASPNREIPAFEISRSANIV